MLVLIPFSLSCVFPSEWCESFLRAPEKFRGTRGSAIGHRNPPKLVLFAKRLFCRNHGVTLGALGAHLPVVLAACNAVIFAVLSIMECRVHPPWRTGVVLALNLAVIALMRFLLAFRYDFDVSLRCFIVLIAAGAANFWISLGALPAALAMAPVCAVIVVSRILGRMRWARGREMPPRVAMRLHAVVALVYFVPVANLMVDRTLLGTMDVECVNDECVRSLRPGPEYGINTERYRGPIAATQAQGATPRLLFLGDSSTFGFGVPGNETYPTRTRELLRARGFPDAEVLNAAVPGHTEVENLARFRRYADWLPTHVFIMGGWHFRNLSRPTEQSDVMDYLRPVRGLAFLSALMAHRMFHREPESEEVSLRLWAIAMRELIDRVRKVGAEPVLLEYPAPDVNAGILASEENLADLRDVAFIHLRDRLAASPERALLVDRCHPNHVGHAIIAEAIAEWFAAGEPVAAP